MVGAIRELPLWGMKKNMDSSRQQSKLQEAKAEVTSLLKVLADKVELERKFGADFVKLDTIKKRTSPSEDEVRSKQPDMISNFGIDHTRSNNELSKAEKVEELKKLEEQVKKCTKCELCTDRTNVVFGTGNPDADLMFVGEAPGYYEDVQGEPFVGKAGQLLTKIIEAIDLSRSDVYIANILKCRPRRIIEILTPNEIVLCSPHLIKQIEIIRPKIICALGTFAAQTLLDTTESIGKLRGKFFEYQGHKIHFDLSSCVLVA